MHQGRAGAAQSNVFRNSPKVRNLLAIISFLDFFLSVSTILFISGGLHICVGSFVFRHRCFPTDRPATATIREKFSQVICHSLQCANGILKVQYEIAVSLRCVRKKKLTVSATRAIPASPGSQGGILEANKEPSHLLAWAVRLLVIMVIAAVVLVNGEILRFVNCGMRVLFHISDQL